MRQKKKFQTQALLNLGNGMGWPDISFVSEPLARFMQSIKGKPRSAPIARATTTIQRKQQDEADKFLRAIEGEVSKWIQKVNGLRTILCLRVR